ncbi:MAG: hypothetical protein PHU66_10360, partial [Bacteroidaceae bacterium]|nr:hypothetical protein [Bacteroidaceae bacterium]
FSLPPATLGSNQALKGLGVSFCKGWSGCGGLQTCPAEIPVAKDGGDLHLRGWGFLLLWICFLELGTLRRLY